MPESLMTVAVNLYTDALDQCQKIKPFRYANSDKTCAKKESYIHPDVYELTQKTDLHAILNIIFMEWE